MFLLDWDAHTKVAAAGDAMFLRLLNTLNEAQARWFVANEVLDRGHGGLKALADLTGMSRNTILKGIRDLRGRRKLMAGDRVRSPGAGRKRIELGDPGLTTELKKIMEETTAGDP